MAQSALLDVQNLVTRAREDQDGPALVDGVSFQVQRGAVVALVGESGSGKSLTALSLLRLLPPVLSIQSGRIAFDGADLTQMTEAALRRLRGNRIGMIFQDPLSSLNPVLTIGQQLTEPLRLHQRLSSRAARLRATQLLAQVQIAAPQRRIDEYPHQLSGGMRQRVMIAAALACAPDLLIADEPTTALDVTVQAQILTLLAQQQAARSMAMLLITHDLSVVRAAADVVLVMYAGRLVETGPAGRVLREPSHPYTRALLHSMPPLEGSDGDETESLSPGHRLPVIPGEPPSLAARPPGCAFHPRCAACLGDARCAQEAPALTARGDGRAVACWKV